MKNANLLALTAFTIFALRVVGQNEINFNIGPVAAHPGSHLLNISGETSDDIEIKYITILNGVVRSSDERMLNNKALPPNGDAQNTVPHSDRVILLTQYAGEAGKESVRNEITCLIALRQTNPDKRYFFYPSEPTSLLKEGTAVGYAENSLRSVPGLTENEMKLLGSVLNELRNAKFNGQGPGSTEPITFKQLGAMLGIGAPKDPAYLNQKHLDSGMLDGDITYMIMRDKRIEKDEGALYKVYFQGNNQRLKTDSVLFSDRSDIERTEPVYDINARQTNGVIMRLSCKPLSGEKLNYFRYSYFGTTSAPKHFRFQLGGKMNSFEPYRTFKVGDTLIHLTTKKTGFLGRVFESSVFIKDSVQLRFPSRVGDTLQQVNVFCGANTGSTSSFGADRQYFLNAKIGNSYFIGEQETSQKHTVGLVKLDAPDANENGYAITRVFFIRNNAVEKIFRIKVPYFSHKPSIAKLLCKDNESVTYLVQMDFPVVYKCSASGSLSLKNAVVEGHALKFNLTNLSYASKIGNTQYLIYQTTDGGKIKLVSL